MNDKKKLIAIIAGVVAVIAVVVLCIVLIPGGNTPDNPDVSNPTESTPSDGNGPSVTPSDNEELLKEYEELKEKVKDIYNVEPVAPFVYDDGTNKHTVKDIVNLFEIFPSKDVKNKETTGTPLKEDIMEFSKNLEKYNHLLLEDPKPVQGANGEMEYPYKWVYIPLELEQYGYKESEYPASTYRYNMYSNTKDIVFVDKYFESKEMYYQACYDVMVEFINMVPKDQLRNSFASTVSYYSLDSLHEACDKGDYTVLFDAIINHHIVFVYKDDAGIFYRLEVSQWDADYDGQKEDCFNITTSYEFDDESKFQ